MHIQSDTWDIFDVSPVHLACTEMYQCPNHAYSEKSSAVGAINRPIEESPPYSTVPRAGGIIEMRARKRCGRRDAPAPIGNARDGPAEAATRARILRPAIRH